MPEQRCARRCPFRATFALCRRRRIRALTDARTGFPVTRRRAGERRGARRPRGFSGSEISLASDAGSGRRADTATAGGPKQRSVFEIGSIAAVHNAPTAASIFTTTRDWTVVEVWTYHWNDAKGSPMTGTIGLKDMKTGKMYGPWKTIGTPGQGGVPNAYWHITTKALLPAGRYKVVDSSPRRGRRTRRADAAAWAASGVPAPGLAWPALPDALVSIESVSNGAAGARRLRARVGDTSTYLNSTTRWARATR